MPVPVPRPRARARARTPIQASREVAAARDTRSALLDEQRARLRSENRARLERTARRELLEERQMVPSCLLQHPNSRP